MVEFIELLIITSLWIWGMHGFFQLTELSTKIRLPMAIRKPLFDCPPCQSSVHGTIAFWWIFSHPTIPLWIAFCFCLCGLNYIIKEHLYGS